MASRPKRTRVQKPIIEESEEDLRSEEEIEEEASKKKRQSKKQAPAKPRGGKAATKKAQENHHAGGPEHGHMLERGLIYFFYRPKVEESEAHGPNDVQRLYIVLSPGADVRHDTESSTHKKRIIIIGQKSLPVIKESGRRNMTWAFVDVVSNDIKDIHNALDKATYSTETRGERHLAPCRPCGEGVYAILDYPRHTHLAYVLELPKEPGTVQNTFHIEREGSYVISIKNPENANPNRGLSAGERAKLPAELEKAFEGRKWNKANPVSLLDYAGVELLLVGVSKNVHEDLGEEGDELKEVERLDAKALTENKLFQELKMSRKEHPAQALFGQWA